MDQPTARVAGWEHIRVQDEVIDKVGLPFTEDLFAHGVPAVVGQTAIGNLTANTIPLDLISDHHGRSYEVGSAQQVTALWADQYGNRYTSLSYKGNNFTRPDIMASLTAPSGYIPYGLQEDDALLRILKSSRILRENGISTEWIVGVTEPAVIPVDDELLSQHEYKKKLLSNVIGKWSVEEAAKIARAIAPMTFFVTARSMEINDRPTDFLSDQSAEQVRERLHKIFTVYNNLHRGDDDFRELSANSVGDCAFYFTTLLPKLQGTNLGRLHDIGLVHKFPVPGNVTTLGGIIDLDSIHGEPLGIGDKPITFDDIRNDILQVFDKDYDSYADLYRHVSGLIDMFDGNGGIALHKMRVNFLDAYCEARQNQLDAREKCLLFLEASRSETMMHVTAVMYEYIGSLLAEYKELYDSATKEAEPLMKACREGVMAFAQAHAERSLDVSYELDTRDPEDEDEARAEEFIDGFNARTMISMESDAIDEALNRLTSGDGSEAFNTLVRALGIGGENEQSARATLGRALLSPFTINAYSIATKLPRHIKEFWICVRDALAEAFQTDETTYTVLALGLDEGREEGSETSDKSPREFYYQLFPYHITNNVSLEKLLESIAAQNDDEHIQLHYETENTVVELPERTFDLPISQWITDGTWVSIQREISSDGIYSQKLQPADNMTYVAALTAADKDGVTHIIIRKKPTSHLTDQ